MITTRCSSSTRCRPGSAPPARAWAYQQLGVQPDIVAFAKKAQLGGIMAGGRVDEVPDNVFAVSGRINSTWGGGLVDMVRSRRMLEIIEAEGLIEAAGPKGARLRDRPQAIADGHRTRSSNVRGRGLFVACDLPDTRHRATGGRPTCGTRAGDRAALRRAVDPVPPGAVGERR